MLTDKSKETGVELFKCLLAVRVGRVRGGGVVDDKLRLSERVYSYACCGILIDRDLNAAIKISIRVLCRGNREVITPMELGDTVRYSCSDLTGSLSAGRSDTYRVQKDITTD